MDQVVTGRFDNLHQAEGAATKLRTIRAQEVEISEWSGSSSIRSDHSGSDNGAPDLNFAYGLGANGMSSGFGGGAGGGVTGGGTSFSTGGFSFLPFMQEDQFQQNGNQGYILNAMITDEQLDRAVRIIREAGGKEF